MLLGFKDAPWKHRHSDPTHVRFRGRANTKKKDTTVQIA
jgi:hypothetical protein